MEIEVGDVIKTPHRRLEVLTVIHKYVIVRDIDFREAGKETYVLQSVTNLCINRVWSLEKRIKNLDMSVLEEL